MTTKQTTDGLKVIWDDSEWDIMDGFVKVIGDAAKATGDTSAGAALLRLARDFVDANVISSEHLAKLN